MPYHENDGARLFYRLQGNKEAKGPVFLFIHGWCSNSTHWQEQINYFGKNNRVLSLDRRGLGRSSTPGSGHTAKQHAKDITSLVRALKIRKVIAVGHAGGGPVTLELTRSYPGLVKATVIVDAGLYPKPRIGDPKSPFGVTLGSMIDALSAPNGEQALKTMYEGFFAPTCPRPITSAAVADALKTPIPLAIQELKVMDVSTQRIAREILQPVLWLTANLVDQAYISRHLKKVQFAQVVGSGHFPQLEVPKQTNAAIETFVSQLK